MREGYLYCQHLSSGVHEVGSTVHVNYSMLPQLDLSRELCGSHTHYSSSLLYTSPSFCPQGTAKLSCFPVSFHPWLHWSGASRPEEDEPADTQPRQSEKSPGTTFSSCFLFRSFVDLRENLYTQDSSEVNQF